MNTTMAVVAVLIAAVAGFAVGAVWYSLLFSRQWMEALGTSPAEIEAKRAGTGGTPLPLLLFASFVGNLIMAIVLSGLLHSVTVATLGGGIVTAFLIWLGFVATVMGINNAFAMRKPMLTVIDGGHWLVVLLVMGAIIGAFG